jgi:CubicO group peptidase (beta-lactamase class C family)
MTETRFHPPQLWRSRTAPTERDPWRQRHLRGEVHDENAWQLGAVAGHAGLFSTGRDLTRFAQLLLRGGRAPTGSGEAAAIFGAETLTAFRTRQSLGGAHRALGWETPTGGNSGGRRLSADAFGHTGFTGTSLWVDPTRDVFVLLLTNRVNPTRQRTGIGQVRPALADAVIGALEATDAPAAPRPASAPVGPEPVPES